MIYIDSCVLIYLLEDDGVLGQRAKAVFAGAREELAISPLVTLECLVRPLRLSDRALLEKYAAVFAELTMLDIDAPAYLHAAELRAATPGLRTVDALHLATAQLGGCTQLWTNDRRLAAASGIFAVDVMSA